MRFDVFLSYASVDRPAIVQPLLKRLDDLGVRSWCDIHEIRWGDSIIEKIQEGLGEARFVIAFISRAYLERDWTMKELRTAMAQQISGRTTVLPVLLDISAHEIQDELPFLSEIRHLSIYNYKQSDTVTDYQLEQLVIELERTQGQLKPIKVAQSFEVLDLGEKVLSVSLNRHYGFYSFLTLREYAEAGAGRRVQSRGHGRSDIRKAISLFIQNNNIPETGNFELCWLDIDKSTSPIYVLQSGNIIRPHRGNALSGNIGNDDYITTGAPPHPCCVTKGPHGEIILGYPDGEIYVWDKQGRRLLGHSTRITSLDTSTESIIASGDEGGNLAIWSRKTGSLSKMLNVGPAPVSNLTVSRSAGAALIAVGDEDGNIWLYTFDGQQHSQIRGHNGRIAQLKFISGIAPFLACARGSEVEIWDYTKGRLLSQLGGHDAPITAMHVASGSGSDFAFFDRDHSRMRIALVTAGFADGHIRGWKLEA